MMKTILKGEIIDNNPVIKAGIANKNLSFCKNGTVFLTVDTGFNGGIALPSNLLAKLKKELVAYESFVLANGKTVVLNVFLGNVEINNIIIETLFIEGDYLIGMEFISEIADKLELDLISKTVLLSKSNI